MRPAGKARRARIPGVFERGATQPAGMQRRPNAAGVSPRAAKERVEYMTTYPEHTNLSILRGCYIFCHEDTKPRLRDFVVAFLVGASGPGTTERIRTR